MKKDKSQNKSQKILINNILKGSLTVSAWTFESLIFLGKLTADAFLNPSYYADLPDTSFLSGAKKHVEKARKNKINEIAIRQSLRRLEKQGFVEKKENIYFFTNKGKQLAEYVKDRKKIISSKWDKKYRVVIFDIPEDNRDFRNWFRRELYLLNYRPLQKSVFVSKYPLTRDLIKEIKNKKMGNYVNYLLVEKVYKNFF